MWWQHLIHDRQSLQIFAHSPHLNTWQETGYEDTIKVGGASRGREGDIDTTMKGTYL